MPAMRVKLTMSANMTVTSENPSAIGDSRRLSRSATGAGRTLSSNFSERSCSSRSPACALRGGRGISPAPNTQTSAENKRASTWQRNSARRTPHWWTAAPWVPWAAARQAHSPHNRWQASERNEQKESELRSPENIEIESDKVVKQRSERRELECNRQ